MKKITVGLLTISLVLLVGCSKGHNSVTANKDTSKPIIKVDQAVITQKMFDDSYNRETGKTAPNPASVQDDQGKLISLIYKDRIVNTLIIRSLLNNEIQKRNITVTDDDVKNKIDEISKKLGGNSKLEATLTLNNINKDEFKKQLKSDLQIQKLIDTLHPASTSDKEVKAFYDQNKTAKFSYPDMVKAQHILIKASKEEIKARVQAMDPEISQAQLDKQIQEEMRKAKAKANDVLSQVKKDPAKFGQFAKKFSEDMGSATNGGDLGFFTRRDMVPEFSKVAFSTTPGQISDIVQSPFGFHIIKVTDRKKAGITPFVEVKDEIKNYLDAQNKMKAVQKLIEGLKNTTEIKYLDTQYDPKGIQEEVKKLAKQAKPQGTPKKEQK